MRIKQQEGVSVTTAVWADAVFKSYSFVYFVSNACIYLFVEDFSLVMKKKAK